MVNSRKYFKQAKSFVSKLSEIAANQTVVQAWRDTSHQIFPCWEVQIYRTSLQKNIWHEQRNMFKSIEYRVYLYESKRQSMCRNWWRSGWEKIPGGAIRNEGHSESLLGHKGPITIDFLKKDATVNSVSYCQLLGKKSSLYLLDDPRIYIYIYWWRLKFNARIVFNT